MRRRRIVSVEVGDSKDEWIERFIEKNPRLTWMDAQQAYVECGAFARFGPLDVQRLLRIQGARSSSHSRPNTIRDRMTTRAAKKREFVAMTPDEVADLPRAARGDALVARAWDGLQKGRRQSQGMGALVELDEDVRNGGFSQYFANHGRRRVQTILKVLSIAGAAKLEQVLKRAAKQRQGDELLASDRAWIRASKNGQAVKSALLAFAGVTGVF